MPKDHWSYKMIVLSFYTENTLYADEVTEFVASLKSVGLHHHVIPVSNRGCWELNTSIKPEIIQSMLHKTTEDILYVDIDARIRKYPKLLDNFEGDIGVHYRNDRELLSGTIFLKNNAKVRKLVDYWVKAQQESPMTWDQKVLAKILSTDKDITVVNLPATYTQIFDLMADSGDPVIEHFQASRHNKEKVMLAQTHPPKVIDGMRVRIASDGTFFIPRGNKAAEQYLDKRFTRVKNELRWFPAFEGSTKTTVLEHEFKDKPCYIVGKGVSLDKLTESIFEKDVPIICINEAIHKVEELNLPNVLICIQQDATLKNTCKPTRPETHLFITESCNGQYDDFKNTSIFRPEEFGIFSNSLTVIFAIKLAAFFGCTEFRLVAFDACITGNTDYASCLEHESKDGGNPNRFLSHRKKIEDAASGILLTWISEPEPSQIQSDRDNTFFDRDRP